MPVHDVVNMLTWILPVLPFAPLDEHFATCPDCLEARAVYERLSATISEAGAGLEPPEGWQRRVWASVEERRRSPWRRPWVWAAVPAVLATVPWSWSSVRSPAAFRRGPPQGVGFEAPRYW